MTLFANERRALAKIANVRNGTRSLSRSRATSCFGPQDDRCVPVRILVEARERLFSGEQIDPLVVKHTMLPFSRHGLLIVGREDRIVSGEYRTVKFGI